ncbi:MAG: type II toxin-antitoxin system RelE/ParE family toxin [Flavobacteriales bacterium]|nr:type II toxin-antitoxin system RelE/ParE family toxin [Flavobacteriales bacterium]
MKVVWTLEALESLRTIYEFILQKSPQNALNVLNELLKLGDSLTNDFAVYSKDPIINEEQFRHITKWPFKIIY